MLDSELFKKYDVPAPRYTSYPTVPYWSDSPSSQEWTEHLRAAAAAPDCSWALYIHVPFCETLCTYCGCNTAITKNHGVERDYIEHVHKEWRAYQEQVPDLARRPLREIHLGGGTPTFLSPENLNYLVGEILRDVNHGQEPIHASIEVDPRRTTKEQLEALYALGFRRVSMGVQDYDPEVQRLVNRIQPYELTAKLTAEARAMGYTSVNHDLIYGLPRQSLASIQRTAELTLVQRPDRIALYSYAHVPWIKAAQRLFTEADLPQGNEKRALYEEARRLLLGGGYSEIGMDHFALPTDSLYHAHERGDLHRNFMGYTDRRTSVLLGLGVSSISEAPTCFHQNEKVLKQYEYRVDAGEIPTLRGHRLSLEDRLQREQILSLMTKLTVELESDAQVADIRSFLAPLLADGLVALQGRRLSVPLRGRPFLRNICMGFDLRLRRAAPERKIFSQAM